MTSPHDEQALLLYAHGELRGLERSRVEGHLRSCPACRKRWEDFRADAGTIRRALETPLPEESASRLSAAIAARIRDTPQVGSPAAAPPLPRSFRSRGWVPVAVAFALLLLLAATAAVVLRARPHAIGSGTSNNPADCGRPPGVQSTPAAPDALRSSGTQQAPAK